MAAVRIAVLVQIGQPIQLRIAIGVILVHDVDLYLSEGPGKFYLAARRQFLRPEQQNLVAHEGLVNRPEPFVIDAPPKIDTDDLGTEDLRERPDLEGPA